MSVRIGTRLIAGVGSVPTIDFNTGCWVIAGINTGIQAVAYRQLNVVLDKANWEADDSTNLYSYNLTISGISAESSISIDIAASLNDVDYITQKYELDKIVRGRVSNPDTITFIAKKLPETMTVDIVVSPTMNKIN